MAMRVKTDHFIDRFLTLPEVQSLLGVKSRKTILKYIRSGKLTAYKMGGTRWRVARKDVDLFLKGEADTHRQVPAETKLVMGVSS